MPEEIKKEWIVLINRAPKGPLVQEEIHALIDEGIIRRNDLACLVHKDKSQKSEWKFLWQFSEFDRRIVNATSNAVTSSSDALPAETVLEERRTPVHDEVLSYKAKTLLPEDIESIHIEDLLIHSTSLSNKNEPELSEDDIKLKETTTERSRPEIVFAGIGLLVVMLFFFVKALKSDGDKEKVAAAKNLKLPLTQKPPETRAPANTMAKRPVSATVQTAPRKVDVPKAPEARDQGDIAYEEYRRKRDQEIERERQREEEERNAESKRDDEENDDEEKPKKKKKDKGDEDATANEQNEDSPVSDEPRDDEENPED